RSKKPLLRREIAPKRGFRPARPCRDFGHCRGAVARREEARACGQQQCLAPGRRRFGKLRRIIAVLAAIRAAASDPARRDLILEPPGLQRSCECPSHGLSLCRGEKNRKRAPRGLRGASRTSLGNLRPAAPRRGFRGPWCTGEIPNRPAIIHKNTILQIIEASSASQIAKVCARDAR